MRKLLQVLLYAGRKSYQPIAYPRRLATLERGPECYRDKKDLHRYPKP